MDQFMADLDDRLVALDASMNKALTGLPAAALDWTPGPDMNSLAVLVSHTAGAQRFWIGDVAGQESSNRVRASEFEATADNAGDLISLLEATLAHSHSVLERLTLDDLGEQRRLADGRSLTVAWALLHALEHTALHTGHIELTRQLWDQRLAD